MATTRKKKSGTIKKPKLAKYPKKPKSNTLAAWKGFEKRCIAVDKANATKVQAYNKKISEKHQAKAIKERLQKKYSSRTPKSFHLKVA